MGFASASHLAALFEFSHQYLYLVAIESWQNLLQFFEWRTNIIVLTDVL